MEKIVAEMGTTIIIDKSTKTKILCINQNKKTFKFKERKNYIPSKEFCH